MKFTPTLSKKKAKSLNLSCTIISFVSLCVDLSPFSPNIFPGQVSCFQNFIPGQDHQRLIQQGHARCFSPWYTPSHVASFANDNDMERSTEICYFFLKQIPIPLESLKGCNDMSFNKTLLVTSFKLCSKYRLKLGVFVIWVFLHDLHDPNDYLQCELGFSIINKYCTIIPHYFQIL